MLSILCVGSRIGRKLLTKQIDQDREELSSRQAMEAIYRDQDGSSADSIGLEAFDTCLDMTQRMTQSWREES